MARKKKIKQEECNHNPDSPFTTLIKSKQTHMIHPGYTDYICKSCAKFFRIETQPKNTDSLKE